MGCSVGTGMSSAARAATQMVQLRPQRVMNVPNQDDV
jgi:hypothetical protein